MTTSTLTPSNGAAVVKEETRNNGRSTLHAKRARTIPVTHKPDSAAELDPAAGRSETFQRKKLEHLARRRTIGELFARLELTTEQQGNNIEALGGRGATLRDLTIDQLQNLQQSLIARVESSQTREPEPEQSIDERVHAAFDHVAMGFTCTLPVLLKETRSRGIVDDDVRAVISDEETDLAHGGSDHNRFRCCGTASGQLYVECTNGVTGRIASAYELFAEVNGQTDRAAYSNGTLSHDLQQRGDELKEREAIVLAAAQTLSKRFKTGAGVSVKSLKRVVARYNPGFPHVDIESTIRQLEKRGIVRTGQQQIRLANPLGRVKTTTPSKLSRMTTSIDQDRVLLCCKAAVCYFKNGNVVPRETIKALMQARHAHGKNQTNRLIKELIAANVLKEVTTHGASGLRLTYQAIRFVKGKFESLEDAAAQIEAAEPSQKPERDRLLSLMESEAERKAVTNTEVSPLAAAVLWIARSVARMNCIQVEELRTALSDAGFTRTEMKRAFGELEAIEVVWFAECSNADRTFVQLVNIKGGTALIGLREGLDAMNS